MIKYPKISNLYARDMEGTKKLIEGEYKEPVFGNIKKWYFTEKVDGMNISVVWDGHSVKFHGRTERAQIPGQLMERLNELFGGSENEQIFEQLFGEKQVILYGEGYGGSIQKGGKYRDTPDFILFDVYMPERDIWLVHDSMRTIARALKINTVPLMMFDNLEDAVKYVKGKPSSFVAVNGAKMEGVVGVPIYGERDRMGNRIMVKIKAVDFQ